jgi:hypothetical protein
MLEFTLANYGLWIIITPTIFPKFTTVEKTFKTFYHCCIILAKLWYTNNGNTTSKHALNGNIISFTKDFESAINL